MTENSIKKDLIICILALSDGAEDSLDFGSCGVEMFDEGLGGCLGEFLPAVVVALIDILK